MEQIGFLNSKAISSLKRDMSTMSTHQFLHFEQEEKLIRKHMNIVHEYKHLRRANEAKVL